MGMTNKADCLQKGEHVKLQVCTVTQTGQKMACNVIPQRRAPVECVKDQVRLVYICCFVTNFKKRNPENLPSCSQFGFITYEVGESKKLFFHVKEVQDGVELQTGDEVEFSVVFNQRTGKCSACNVRRVRYEPGRRNFKFTTFYCALVNPHVLNVTARVLNQWQRRVLTAW